MIKGLAWAALLLALAWSVAGDPSADRVVTQDLGPQAIKGVVLPMMGEGRSYPLPFARPVWLKAVNVTILDEQRKPSDQLGIFCHATFARSSRAPLQQYGLFQDGYTDMTFPEGYALALDSGTYHLGVMLQSEHASTDRSLYVRRVVRTIEKSAAPGMRPLRIFYTAIEGNENRLQPILPEMVSSDPKFCTHWQVPPGRSEFATTFRVPQDGSIKYISFHLHPYAREAKLLVDAGPEAGPSAWKTLYAGEVRLRDDGEIMKMPFYSDSTGLPISAGKRYRFSLTYNNTRSTPVSGMGVIYLFYHAADAQSPEASFALENTQSRRKSQRGQ